MKNFCLIIGILSFAKCLNCQYSYVYEIRHDNKQPKSELFGDLSQYKHTVPDQLPRAAHPHSRPPPQHIQPSQPQSQANNRKFNVKSPEVGSTILNLLKQQLLDKQPEGPQWQPSPNKYSTNPLNSLSYQSDTNSPIYASQPSFKSHEDQHQLPVYSDRHQGIPKGYPMLEHHRPSHPRDEHREQRGYERPPPPHHISYGPPPPPPQSHHSSHPSERQTVHQIQTSNYRINLLSEPESLDKIMSQMQSQPLPQPLPSSYPQPHPVPTYSSQPFLHEEREPQHRRPAKQPYVLQVESISRRPEPLTHTISQVPEEPRHQLSPKHIHRPIHEPREPVSYEQPIDAHYSSEPLPQPILELPKQQLPPQAHYLSRPIHQLPPPEPHPMRNSGPYGPLPPPSQPRKYEPSPVQHGRGEPIYQMQAPDLSHVRPAQPIPHYSRVEYQKSMRDSDRESGPYGDERGVPVYRYEERPKEADIVSINEQIEKLHPSDQNKLFRELLSKSIDITPDGQLEYSRDGGDGHSPIATDPNYKSPPIPNEYKPYTQTKIYKTYVKK